MDFSNHPPPVPGISAEGYGNQDIGVVHCVDTVCVEGFCHCISHLEGSKGKRGCTFWKDARWGEIGLIWVREWCDWGVQAGTIGQSDALTPLPVQC